MYSLLLGHFQYSKSIANHVECGKNESGKVKGGVVNLVVHNTCSYCSYTLPLSSVTGNSLLSSTVSSSGSVLVFLPISARIAGTDTELSGTLM